jgi:tetratricopeptide (TPR) repeat protein
VKARIQFGRFLSRQGRLEEARAMLDQAWQSVIRGDDACRAECCRELAVLFRTWGSGDLPFRQLALKAELRQQGGPSGVSLWLAAREALAGGRREDAERLLAASMHCTPAPRPADVLAERGRQCGARGDLSDAVRHLRKSARWLLQDNDLFTAARVLESLGQVCCDDQRFRTATKVLRRAADLYRRMDREEDARRTLAAAREADRRRFLLRTAAERN